MLNTEDLEKLKKRLPRGYFKKVIEKSNMSEKSVANFFSGKSYNIDIHEAAIDVAEAWEQEVVQRIHRKKAIVHG